MQKNLTIILSCILISLFLISVVSAADTFWDRWKESALRDTDAKILLLILIIAVLMVLLSAMGLGTGKSLLISIPIAVILTAFVTPESVIGIFKSYDTTSLTIATILPLLIFFALTYVSVVKESRTLMTIQIISWGIFFFYNAVKFVFGGGLQFLGIYSGGKWNMFTDLPLWGTTEGDWFWGATFIQGIIAALMFFKNGLFMNWAIKMTAGIDKGKADLTARDVETAVNFLKNVEKTATKER